MLSKLAEPAEQLALSLVVPAPQQLLKGPAGHGIHQIRLKPHEQMLVVGDETLVYSQPEMHALGHEPVIAKLSPALGQHLEGIMHGCQQLDELGQGAAFKEGRVVVLEEQVVIPCHGREGDAFALAAELAVDDA